MDPFAGCKISLEALKAGYFKVTGWDAYPKTSSKEGLDEPGLKDIILSWDEEMIRSIGGTLQSLRGEGR